MAARRRYIPHPQHVPFEYSRITEYVYIGTNQCCQKHFDESLLARGITADISLEENRLDAPFGVSYFFWMPVTDHTAPTAQQLLIGAVTLKEFVDNGIKVYVHCKRGHGRSPTLAAAYFILEGDRTNEAIRRMREKRDIHLRMSQIQALREFERLVLAATSVRV
ncbi:MAG: dual specificity protein phosphatase family protein [Chloroflexi bacterium]|nr:dual specificity protein phosphatase family protein [Chloroflexota bacterium]